MELTSRQRLLTFVVIVLVLGGLGAYLFVSGTHKNSPSAASSHPPTPAPTTSAPVAPPTPAQSSGSTTSSQVNIYNWLPFTQHELSQAASVTQEFSAYYGTYSYNESTASYIGRMRALATSSLVKVIQGGYTSPGVAGLRNQQKQVSAGSAVINSIRTFGSDSITFVVTINQKITENHGTKSQQTHQYAVTVASGGSGWQVNDIELASLGNQ
jgi:hypothetical protein